jgi:hypothetical protein
MLIVINDETSTISTLLGVGQGGYIYRSRLEIFKNYSSVS